jgi:hypothetical protein
MHTSTARHAIVLGLILVAGLAAAGLRLQAQDRAVPRLPQAGALVGGSQWRVDAAFQPGGWDMAYRQWLLRDPSGRQALLYLGVTSRVQTALRWTGELGYQGEGYLVSGERPGAVAIGGGRSIPVTESVVMRLTDQRLLQYAVIGPSGPARQGLDLVPAAAWDSLRGRAVTYYLIRVSVPMSTRAGSASTTAGDVLRTVLPRLLASEGWRA